MEKHFENDLVLADKRKHRKIIVDGEVVATAIYNPDDPAVYKQLLLIRSILDKTESNTKNFDSTEEEQTATQNSMNDIDTIIEAVNAIYGAGICEVLLRYGTDGEYLSQLLKLTFKEVNRARQVVKNKYKADTQSGTIE